MRQLIAGNWKMNGLTSSLREVADLSSALRATPPHCDVLVCPPATLISRAVQTGGVAMMFGGQDCHAETSGAYTGDLSAEMLADAGAKAVIVGHSERRRYHGETDALVASKARAAWRAGLFAIICIGETLSERESGLAETICKSQLSGSVPTGATGENTGGSVNATNAREILSLSDVDGALVGGASLKAAEFLAIISACRAT
jgi:triosephosphate isomerase